MAKVIFTQKEDLIKTNIPSHNKVSAKDLNEIKKVVNFNDDDKTSKGGYTGTTKDLKDELDNAVFDGAKTYQTEADLLAVSPIPVDGTPAKVANDPDTAKNGNWSVVSGAWVINSSVLANISDSTDIKTIGDELRFNDRDKTINSLGYKYIRSDFNFEAIPTGYDDSIWEIVDSFELEGSSITLPENATFYFNGGKLSNCTITGDNLTIKTINDDVVFENVTFLGTFKNYNINANNFDNDSLFSFVNNIETPINLKLSEGEYIFPTSLLIPENSKVEGEGIGKTIIKKQDNSTNNQPLIRNKVDSSNVIISNLSIDGNSANQTVSANLTRNSGIQIINGSNSIIENCEVYNCSYSDALDGGSGAISLGESSNNCTISSCIVYDNEFSGIISKNSLNTNIDGNKVYNNKVSGIDTNTLAENSIVTNNIVYDNGLGFNQISCNSRNQTITNNRVYRSNLVTNGDFDYNLDGWTNSNSYWTWVSSQEAYHAETTSNNPLIQSIPFLENGYKKFIKFKLRIITGEVNVVYKDSGNTSIQEQFTESGTYFISTDDVLADTSISFSRYAGISTEFYLSEVECIDIGAGGGINLTHATAVHKGDNTIIANNFVKGSVTGITLGRTNELNVCNNIVEFTEDGIRLVDEIYNSNINSNLINYILDSGIQINNSENIFVTGNHILNSNNYGIFITDTSHKISVTNNIVVDKRDTPVMDYCLFIAGSKTESTYVNGNVFKGYVIDAWSSSGAPLKGANLDDDDYNFLNTSVYLYSPWTTPKYKKIATTSDEVMTYDDKNIQFTLSGATASRPNAGWVKIGKSYFDTNLGYPVFWDGTNWVNSSGTTV